MASSKDFDRWLTRGAWALVLSLVMLGLPADAPAADEPAVLWQEGENCGIGSKLSNGECGAAAGPGFVETVIPRGIAADSATGHVFVADQNNARVVEFDAWGQFIKAWGWGVVDGTAVLQSCTEQTGCLEGLQGEDAGQFGESSPAGVAVDSSGFVYVVDRVNHRVQKFDPTAGPGGDEAAFMVMFGGDVNKTKVEAAAPEPAQNRCPVDPSDVCQKGVTGAGDGQFEEWPISSVIAIGSSDEVYVGDKGRIQEFDTAGNYVASVPLPGESVFSLAVDAAGDLYVSLQQGITLAKPGIQKIKPTGELICTAFSEDPNAKVTDNPTAIAMDPAGGLYAFDGAHSGELVPASIVHFDEACGVDSSFQPADLGFSTGIATNTVTEDGATALYSSQAIEADSFIRAYHPPPDKWPPPLVPPTIADQYAIAATATGATVRAEINPRFWADATYYVEYGTGECSAGGCPNRANFPGALLGAGIVDAEIRTAGVFLAGLAPNTTYNYRFVAQSGGSGGQSVRGVGGKLGEDGTEASFTTFALPEPPPSPDPCPNAAFRGGASASLPDCRAYEMVSPVEKGEYDIRPLSTTVGVPSRIDQATPQGDKLTYTSARPFADAVSAPWSSQYIATRDAAGWATENISPPRGGGSFYGVLGQAREIPYRAFSEDLCSGWLVQDVEMPLAAGAVPGYTNLYRRENCGAGSHELISDVAPLAPQPAANDYQLGTQGHNSSHTLTVFRANGRLTDGASAAAGVYQLYAKEGGELRLVSVLPGGSGDAADSHATVGSSGAGASGSVNEDDTNFRYDNVHHAVSEDGSLIYWSSGRKIYLRLNLMGGGAECTTAETPCTLAVSGQVSSQAANFWQATPDGERALFDVEGTLYEFDATTASAQPIAAELVGVIGASEDLARVYLVSEAVLASGAQAGQPNLYLYEGGDFRFIATLSSLDLFGDLGASNAGSTSPISKLPYARSARVSPDGLTAVFTSAASPTGYDNSDAVSGRPDSGVYLFDAEAEGGQGKLMCVSCNPSGIRPSGRQLAVLSNGAVRIWAVARLPGWETLLHPSRVLSDDGKRLFFESFEALVLSDTNGAQDVYEWEAPGKGDCTTADPTYTSDRGGCVRLVSSGDSPADSDFVDASASGDDIFITTRSGLVPRDPGLIDIYDARVGGGFAEPQRPAECEGDACQGPAPSANAPTPSSATFQGPGNVRSKQPRRCPRGKRKVKRAGKTRCIPKKGNLAQERHRRGGSR